MPLSLPDLIAVGPDKAQPESASQRLLWLSELVKHPGWRLVMGEQHARAMFLLETWLGTHVTEAERERHNQDQVEAKTIYEILKSVRDRIVELQGQVKGE